MQKDGFIVPIHGSLIHNKPKTNVAVYKTSKKRWLETFIQEGANKCLSPVLSPKQTYSPSRENITPEKEVSSPGSQVSNYHLFYSNHTVSQHTVFLYLSKILVCALSHRFNDLLNNLHLIVLSIKRDIKS